MGTGEVRSRGDVLPMPTCGDLGCTDRQVDVPISPCLCSAKLKRELGKSFTRLFSYMARLRVYIRHFAFAMIHKHPDDYQ
jgi:hypothetical protein